MPDFLTHVLVGYTLAAMLSLRHNWIKRSDVTVCMAGALAPDLSKIELLISSTTVESLIGAPFDWFAFHTLGGVTVSIAVGSLLVTDSERRRVFGLLALGAGSHLFLDTLLVNVSGYSYPVFWPVTMYHPPTPSLFWSSDRWPLAVAAVSSCITWSVRGHIWTFR